MIENKKLTGCCAEKLLEGVGLEHRGVPVGMPWVQVRSQEGLAEGEQRRNVLG